MSATYKHIPVDIRIGDAFLLVYRPAHTPPRRVFRNTICGVGIGWAFRVGTWIVSFGRHV